MLKAYLRHDDICRKTNLYLIFENENGTRSVIEPISMTVSTMPTGQKKVEPTMQFDDHDATSFLECMANELATLGFTPDKQKMVQGELASVRYHLEDMRRLVFDNGSQP